MQKDIGSVIGTGHGRYRMCGGLQLKHRHDGKHNDRQRGGQHSGDGEHGNAG